MKFASKGLRFTSVSFYSSSSWCLMNLTVRCIYPGLEFKNLNGQLGAEQRTVHNIKN